MILCLKIANILTDIVWKFLINQISGRGSKTTFCISAWYYARMSQPSLAVVGAGTELGNFMASTVELEH